MSLHHWSHQNDSTMKNVTTLAKSQPMNSEPEPIKSDINKPDWIIYYENHKLKTFNYNN